MKAATTMQEFFKQAGEIRGALWLLLILYWNASNVDDRQGWRICWQGRPQIDRDFSDALGASEAVVARWRERLKDLGEIKFEEIAGGRRYWTRSGLDELLGSLRGEETPPPRVH